MQNSRQRRKKEEDGASLPEGGKPERFVAPIYLRQDTTVYKHRAGEESVTFKEQNFIPLRARSTLQQEQMECKTLHTWPGACVGVSGSVAFE